MGVSTNGIIAYGVICEEGLELPWLTREYDCDIQDWWFEITGFQSRFQPFTEDGNYAEGWTREDPRLEEYYDERREWLTQNPIPVEVENYCSGDVPMFALVIPETNFNCRRGYPVRFDPAELSVTTEQVEVLKSFCEAYDIKYQGEPGWLLMSYWG